MPGPPAIVRSPLDGACEQLLALHAAAVAADRHTGEETTRATVEESLRAHAEHQAACDEFRRRHFPRAGRVVAVFDDVLAVSPAGRRITLVYTRPAKVGV